MRAWRKGWATVALLVSIVPTAGAQGASLEGRLREALSSLVAAQGLVGATAAISVDGVVASAAAGFSDRERQHPMKVTDRMLVGSSGKPFFAFVALNLAAEGRLDLDAPIARWLRAEPWFSRLPNAEQITMRQLLSHRSGIANHVADSAFATAMRTAADKRLRGFTPAEQIAYVLDRPAPFRAGEGFLYTDTGYLIAALVLERVAGRTYYQELADRVLTPLHLDGTSPSDHADLPGLAQGYPAAPRSPSSNWGLPPRMVSDGRLAINPMYEWTGGGVVSTTSDLARWIETLFEQKPWKSIGDAMIAGAVPGATYGLGIFVQSSVDGVLYSHPGGFPGYRTMIAYSPELGVGVAFQTNSESVNLTAVLHAIIEVARHPRLPSTPR